MAPPDPRRAWNFFYGRTLPRREAETFDQFGKPLSWRKLEPVESGGELYPIMTPLRELGDFGLGVGLYFSIRVAMVIIFSLIGFLNALTIMAYYRSEAYDPSGSKDNLPYDMRASAICEFTMKVCLNWECKEKSRRHLCPVFRFEDGFVDIVSIAILLAYLVLITIAQQHQAESIDAGEPTAQDYSIVVRDPPADAVDPEEWRTYFSTYGHVTYVSIGLDNGDLLLLLAKKRSVLMELHKEEGIEQAQLQKSTFSDIMNKIFKSFAAQASTYAPVQTEEPAAEQVGDGAQKSKRASAMGRMSTFGKVEARASWHEEDDQKLDSMVDSIGKSEAAASWRRKEEGLAFREAENRDYNGHFKLFFQDLFPFTRDSTFFRARMHKLEREIQIQAQLPPKAVRVFVTFESAVSQQKCLQALKVSQLNMRANRGLPFGDRFRFQKVLSISEAPEPHDIMWTELSTTPLQLAVSLLGGVAAVLAFCIAGAIIMVVFKSFPWIVGLSMAGLNMAVAPVMNYVTLAERHMTRQSEHISMLLKLVTCRWFTSVIVYKALTPFENTIAYNSIATVRAILLSDMFLKPALQVLDIPGFIDHYILSMMMDTQEKMNRLFLGARWSLAERYSGMSTSIFITLSFAAIYPFSYFICAMANFLSFASDKYCMFRVWKQQAVPENAELTSIHRSTLAIAFFAHALFTLWYFADWPFEDLCRTGEMVPDWVMDKIDAKLLDNYVYKECDMESHGFIFGVRGGRGYMTEGQVLLIFIYKFVTASTMLIIIVAYFGTGILQFYRDFFIGQLPVSKDPPEALFSEVEFIEGYIPGLEDPLYSKPLLACDLTKLNTDHINWEGKWDAYNVNSEIDFPDMSTTQRNSHFGACVNYPPSAGGPKETYHQYVQARDPDAMDLLKQDAENAANKAAKDAAQAASKTGASPEETSGLVDHENQ